MIAYIAGELLEEDAESVIVNANGVGYQLFCSRNTLDDFFGQKNVKAWVYTHVREDALSLYGFSGKMEKQIFESLMSVNGVGPKLAIKILSGAPIQKIAELIESADVKGLTQIPKVGKKTAEQIVLTLKGKIQVAAEDGGKAKAAGAGGVRVQIQSALVHLGFRSADVERALERLPNDIGFEDGVREGLALLSGT